MIRFSQIVERPIGSFGNGEPPRRTSPAEARDVSREYRFLTTWILAVEREWVWEALWDSSTWPSWWEGVREAVETAPGDPDGLGRRGHYEWRSRIPYPVHFEVVATRVERPWLLEGRASGGLEGTGVWRLLEHEGLTFVLYDWRVRTTKP